MTELIPGLIFCLLVAALLVYLAYRRLAFIVRLRQGRASTLHGDPDDQFLIDIERIADLWAIPGGVVLGIAGKRRTRIRCIGPIKAQRRALQNAIDHAL